MKRKTQKERGAMSLERISFRTGRDALEAITNKIGRLQDLWDDPDYAFEREVMRLAFSGLVYEIQYGAALLSHRAGRGVSEWEAFLAPKDKHLLALSKPWLVREVFLVQDDRDEIEGIGVGIYPASDKLIRLAEEYLLGKDDGGEYENERDRIRATEDVLERVYGPSEEAAWSNARLKCERMGWERIDDVT